MDATCVALVFEIGTARVRWEFRSVIIITNYWTYFDFWQRDNYAYGNKLTGSLAKSRFMCRVCTVFARLCGNSWQSVTVLYSS